MASMYVADADKERPPRTSRSRDVSPQPRREPAPRCARELAKNAGFLATRPAHTGAGGQMKRNLNTAINTASDHQPDQGPSPGRVWDRREPKTHRGRRNGGDAGKLVHSNLKRGALHIVPEYTRTHTYGAPGHGPCGRSPIHSRGLSTPRPLFGIDVCGRRSRRVG